MTLSALLPWLCSWVHRQEGSRRLCLCFSHRVEDLDGNPVLLWAHSAPTSVRPRGVGPPRGRASVLNLESCPSVLALFLPDFVSWLSFPPFHAASRMDPSNNGLPSYIDHILYTYTHTHTHTPASVRLIFIDPPTPGRSLPAMCTPTHTLACPGNLQGPLHPATVVPAPDHRPFRSSFKGAL